MALFGRSLSRKRYRRRKLVFLATLVIFLLDAFLITTSYPTPVRTSTLPAALREQKIFIVSINRNSEYVLRLYWSSALLALVQALGPANVFVSIVESGSQDDTKGALRDLEAQLNGLGVENSIVLGTTVDEQYEMLMNPPDGNEKEGWIFTGRNVTGWELRRIPHLAGTRNRAMEPLSALSPGRRFDKVLWVNDVVFTVRLCALDPPSSPPSHPSHHVIPLFHYPTPCSPSQSCIYCTYRTSS